MDDQPRTEWDWPRCSTGERKVLSITTFALASFARAAIDLMVNDMHQPITGVSTKASSESVLKPSPSSPDHPGRRSYMRLPYTSADRVMSDTSILPLVSGPQSSEPTNISAAPTVPTSIGIANPVGCPAANAAITGATRPPQIAP